MLVFKCVALVDCSVWGTCSLFEGVDIVMTTHVACLEDWSNVFLMRWWRMALFSLVVVALGIFATVAKVEGLPADCSSVL